MITALARRLLWRAALALIGGVQVEGRLASEGSVLVANHTSHADTAALLAAVPARRRPAIAAASDYWFRRRWTRLVCRLLAAGFPVRRGGGGSADLRAAAAYLHSGRSVAIFAEGTRSRDGTPGKFRSGAARLAASAGVPLVPVAISGTNDVLPVHGRLHRGRVTVRIGAPVTVGDPREATEAARSQITTMLAAPQRPPRSSRSRELSAGVFAGRLGVAIVGAWAAAEAMSWPLLPEVVLFVALLAVPRRWTALVPAAVIGSVAGGMLAWTLAAAGLQVPQPLVTEPMQQLVVQQVDADGAAAMRRQPLSGVPYKVYAARAGSVGIDPAAFGAESLVARGSRIGVLGLAFAGLGVAVGRRPRAYPWVIGLAGVGFAAGLATVVATAGLAQ